MISATLWDNSCSVVCIGSAVSFWISAFNSAVPPDRFSIPDDSSSSPSSDSGISSSVSSESVSSDSADSSVAAVSSSGVSSPS